MIGLLTKFTPRILSDFDEDKMLQGLQQQKLKPLGTFESSEGFESPLGANDGELVVRGGSVAIMAKFVRLEHEYDKSKVKKIVSDLVAKEKNSNSEEKDSKEKGGKKKFTEQAKSQLRKDGKTNTKESVIHFLVFKSRGEFHLYIEADYNSKLLENFSKLFPIIGLKGVELDKEVEFDEVNDLFSNAYTEFLKNSSLMSELIVESPIKMGETIKIDLGGNCTLVESDNDASSKEKAVLEEFDLTDREDVILHLERKKASLCQFTFGLDEINYKFSHSEKHVFSGVKTVKITGAKLNLGEPNMQVMNAAYAMRIMHLASKKMLDIV